MTSSELAEIFLKRWLHVRSMTYDYLDMLDESQLSLKLPFPESQPIGYQFWCMTGAHESYLKELEFGDWQGFSSSMDQLEHPTPAAIKANMQQSDRKMAELLRAKDLEAKLDSGKYGYELVQLMIEHEMHHQGQLINLMYCHHLPIPKSWRDKWALSYEE
jgi:hypothetical protein